MKFYQLAAIAGISALAATAAAAPEATGQAVIEAGKSLHELVGALADDNYQVREDASRDLWRSGDRALPVLEEAAKASDPEQAYRAREIIRKIELFITPETDPEVISMVEQYRKASENDKVDLLDGMIRKKAWRQILKLYASEKSPEVRENYGRKVELVSVIAARESILAGRTDEAREYLELAPATPSGLLSLADFHRGQGTLQSELDRAEALPGEKGDAWRTALYRAAGNLAAARDCAAAAGEERVSSAMSVLLGDPVPWMRGAAPAGRQMDKIFKSYTDLAIGRWQGGALEDGDFKYLEELSASTKNSRERANMALFLLGRTEAAERDMAKREPLNAFLYFSTMDKVPQALEALGLDPDHPDYETWVGERFGKLAADGDDAGPRRNQINVQGELLALAMFFDTHGLEGEAESAFLAPLAKLAEDDESAFTQLLGRLFDSRIGAPALAARAAVAWAGDDDGRWSDVIEAASATGAGAGGGREEYSTLWEWMGELDPAISRPERLQGFLSILGNSPDPQRLRDHWVELAWQEWDKADPDNRKQMLSRMFLVCGGVADLGNELRLLKAAGDKISKVTYAYSLTAIGKWGEVSDILLKTIANGEKSKGEVSLQYRAFAAAALRRAGRTKEAAVQDQLLDKLALGRDALVIAKGYDLGSEFATSAKWKEKAAREADPQPGRDDEFLAALEGLAGLGMIESAEGYGEILLDRGEWAAAGAANEVLTQAVVQPDINVETPILGLRYRLEADLGRGLSKLATDREEAIRILADCPRIYPNDGSLADFFFPCVRRAGLAREHDEWFAESWKRVTALITRFPEAENSCNTAAWLAARACRELDAARKLSEKALALNPDQAAYLDTMAEIEFASGDRNKALEWSAKAVNFSPRSILLRQQYERFRTDPLPKP